jgi:hypothetical protein
LEQRKAAEKNSQYNEDSEGSPQLPENALPSEPLHFLLLEKNHAKPLSMTL